MVGLDPRWRLGQQAHHRKGRDALPAAALADDPERLAGGELV
jgi:hypothetical protein